MRRKPYDNYLLQSSNFRQSAEMYTNRICAVLPEHRLIFCSEGESDSQNYIMDTNTGVFEPYSCEYQGKPFTLQTFRMVD